MMRRFAIVVARLLPVIVLASACASAREPAGAAPAPGHHGSAAASTGQAAVAQFMEHMIHHHAQALAMARLVPARTTRPELRLLAERIDVSQRDEIAQMQRWLRERGLHAPDPLAHSHGDRHEHGHDLHAAHGPMPGMLTDEQMGRLAAARGAEFDRLLLVLMIQHHEGALDMVADLFGTPGATDDPEIFQLASEMESDQRLEISRMQRLLAIMATGGSDR